MSAPLSTPAARLITEFGVERLSRWTRRHRSRVHAWAWPAMKGGTGGVIPHKARVLIIAGAEAELGLKLTHADFEPRDGETYLLEAA